MEGDKRGAKSPLDWQERERKISLGAKREKKGKILGTWRLQVSKRKVRTLLNFHARDCSHQKRTGDTSQRFL